MQLPMQITWRDMEPSLAVETKLREEAAKLEEFYDRISSCRVMIEIPHQHQHRGYRFQISIDLTVPGGEIVVNHGESRREPELSAPHKNIYVAIRDAFKIARRRLQKYAHIRSGAVKYHETVPQARVVKLGSGVDLDILEAGDIDFTWPKQL